MIMLLRQMAGVAWGMRRAALVACLLWAAGWQPGPYAGVQIASDLFFAWLIFWLFAQWRRRPGPGELMILPVPGVRL